MIVLGAILLIYASGGLRRDETIRLVVKKRPQKLPPLIAKIHQVLKEVNDGLRNQFGAYHWWKIGSMFYLLILASLFFLMQILGNTNLFVTNVLLWFGGGVAGLFLLSVKRYSAGEGGCGCLGILLESLGGEFAILGIIPLLLFASLGPIILIIALIIKPRTEE